MTDQKKTGITLTALVAAVILVAGAWKPIEPALTWVVANLGAIFAREQVQALLASSAIGITSGAWLPHLLPSGWPAGRTKLVTGLIGAGLTFAAALALVPDRVGFVYAMLAASATPTASQAIAGLIYWLKPCAKPASLK
ncbi:hypothetical protein [Arenimonas alkanexedens]